MTMSQPSPHRTPTFNPDGASSDHGPATVHSCSAGRPRTVGLTAVLASALALALAACGGGGDDSASSSNPPVGPTAQLTGVAATGAAISGATVTAINAAGAKATAVTGADGRYTLTIGESAPYALTVTDSSGKAWYSYAPTAGTAHITPLTTLALLDANGNKPLANLVDAWPTNKLADSTVLQSAQRVNANLRPQLAAAGVDASSVNVFASSFSADHTGLDAVLDALRVNINCSAGSCQQTITNASGATVVSWNATASTSGITLSWTSGAGAGGGSGSSGTLNVSLGACKATATAGTYSMVVQTSVEGLGTGSIPDICVDGLPDKPTGQAEFCDNGNYKDQLPAGVSIVSCSYADPTGTITARITSPVTLDYTVKFSFVKR